MATVTVARSRGRTPAVPLKVGVVSLVARPSAGLSRETTGGVVSTSQLKDAGVDWTLPALSIAWTANVWVPSLRELYEAGLVQSVHDPASSLHWVLARPDIDESLAMSLAENVKLAVVALVGSAGWVRIELVGSWVSTRVA